MVRKSTQYLCVALLLQFGSFMTSSSGSLKAEPPLPGNLKNQGVQNEGTFFSSEDQVIDFMTAAQIGKMKVLAEGITGSRKVSLVKDGRVLEAIFRTIDEHPERKGDKTEGERDYFLYESAAYELSKMLGVSLVPPAIQRQINDENGTLQLWIPDAMMEKDRAADNIAPPDMEAWTIQRETVSLFDSLIFNSDRHRGNLLVDTDWKIWCIDHTRSFRTPVYLRFQGKLTRCPKVVWQNLQKLNKDQLTAKLSPFLTKDEISSLDKRRKKLIKHFESRIKKQGYDQIIVDAILPGFPGVSTIPSDPTPAATSPAAP